MEDSGETWLRYNDTVLYFENSRIKYFHLNYIVYANWCKYMYMFDGHNVANEMSKLIYKAILFANLH